MRAALATLGMPGASIEAIAEMAATTGFVGVELRVGPAEAVHIGLSRVERLHVRRCLEAADVRPLSIASYIKVVDPGYEGSAVLADARTHLQLAHDLGAPYLRVFPGGSRDRPATRSNDEWGGRRLAVAVEAAQGLGVAIALETHDSHGTAARTRDLLDQPGCGDVVAIWDVLHTWLAGEAPIDSVRSLGERLAYVQVKDVRGRSDLTPLVPGDGALPLGDVAAVLRAAAYRGWVSWEYELAWHPGLPDIAGPAARARRRIEGWFG